MRIFDAKSTEASKAEERVDVKEKGIYEEVPEKSMRLSISLELRHVSA